MFDVSALLINDALLNVLLQKSSCFHLLYLEDTDISQVSVAVHLSCDGIFSDSTIFMLILAVKR